MNPTMIGAVQISSFHNFIRTTVSLLCLLGNTQAIYLCFECKRMAIWSPQSPLTTYQSRLSLRLVIIFRPKELNICIIGNSNISISPNDGSPYFWKGTNCFIAFFRMWKLFKLLSDILIYIFNWVIPENYGVFIPSHSKGFIFFKNFVSIPYV